MSGSGSRRPPVAPPDRTGARPASAASPRPTTPGSLPPDGASGDGTGRAAAGAHARSGGGEEHELLKSAGRAFGGALLFALPLFMTMEVWELGYSIERSRFALLLVATVALVVAMSRYFGLRSGGIDWPGALADAGVALAVAALVAALVMGALGVILPVRDWDWLSVVAIQTLPAAVGASFARSQLGKGDRGPDEESYGYELFLMLAGAVVFSANIAPTEEVLLVAAGIGPLFAVGIVVGSIVVMHGLVYWAGFKGQELASAGFLHALGALTLVGYLICLATSAYLLWTFGRFDGVALDFALTQAVVLALPAGIGAAVARLIL